MGYEKMSERGRMVAEIVELMTRLDVLIARSAYIPGYKPPVRELRGDISGRFEVLSDVEKAAVAALRAGQNTGWDRWLKAHLAQCPADAIGLYNVQNHFGRERALSTYVRENFGAFDRPWQMLHKW